MTKHRPPLSDDAALARIAGTMRDGWATMATLTGRTARTVRNWGDPDTAESVPFDCMLILDIAFREAGGIGAPLHEAYTAQLGLAGSARFAKPIAIGRILPEVILESSEASAALARIAQPGATRADEKAAIEEVDQAIGKLQQARHAVLSDPDQDQHPSTGPPDQPAR